MNELYHKLLVTLLFVVPLVFLQVGGKVCYIAQSSRDKIEDSGDDNVIQWQKATNTQIASCTKLQFSPNNYTLIKRLEIIAVSNFMINSNGAIFHCNSSSLIVSNSTTVQIMNATFTNCGYAVNNFVTPRKLFPSLTKAAIILHNSFSIIVKNVIFENSPGYAIIGINVMEESHYENITVTYFKSTYNKQENLQMIGGIILVYSQTHVAHRNVKVFIKHCDINNINSSTKIEHKGENSVISADHLSHAIGLIIHQLLYVETQIHNLVVTNITTVNGPLFLVSIHSTELCALNLTLNNSTFSNNKSNLYPVVNYLLNSSCSSKQLPAVFTISNSKFCRNHNATHIFEMSNIANESATLVLEGRNEFLENSVTSSLLSVFGAIPVIRNCTTIENNTANIIFTFSRYIELHKSARVEIIGNKYNPTQKSFNRFIFEKISQISTRCPFQLNRAFSFVKFCNNIGYYRELYGTYLKYNCSWIESLQKEYQNEFDFKSPEYTYRRTVFNCDKEAGLFKWENDLLSCNHFHTFGKASLDVTHPPVYPGQSITLTLLHLQKSIRMYSDFANSNSVFTDILPTCQLDFSKHTIDIVYKTCTNLSYTIKSNSTKVSSCLFNLQTATPKNTLYSYI